MISCYSVILIVDDSSGIRNMIKTQLQSLGFSQMLEANNGKEAIEVLDNQGENGSQIHLLIADWKMPD